MHAMALTTQNVCYLMNKDCVYGGYMTSPWKLIVVRAAILKIQIQSSPVMQKLVLLVT